MLKGRAQAPSQVTFPSREVAGVDGGESQGHRPGPKLHSGSQLPLHGVPGQGPSGMAWGVGQELDGRPAGTKPILHFQFAKQARGFRLEEPRRSQRSSQPGALISLALIEMPVRAMETLL